MTTPPAESRTWTIAQIAALLQVTPRHVHRLRRRPDFPAPIPSLGRALRFRDADVQEFLSRRRPR
jgi:predicted DNA-binding transcriptional regulator AlpA